MAEATFTTIMTAAIVAAYARSQTLNPPDLVRLISAVGHSLNVLPAQGAPAEKRLEPAVPVDRSVTRDHIVCLEDGKWFKTLTRHLSSVHNLSPQQYRTKWGLPSDYPMMSQNYAAARHRIAKQTRR